MPCQLQTNVRLPHSFINVHTEYTSLFISLVLVQIKVILIVCNVMCVC